MKSVSSWPRWARALAGAAAVATLLVAGVAFEYQTLTPHLDGKTTLAQQF